MKAVFKVLAGPVEHESLVVRDGESLTIGREQKADIPVPGDSQMSSLHLRVECVDDQCVIHDLKSTNGTFVNGRQVTDPLVVAEGDVIRCGTTEFEVELIGARAPGGAATAPPVAGGATVPASEGAAPTDSPATVMTARPSTAATESDTPVLKQVRGFIEDTATAVARRFDLVDLPAAPEPAESPEDFARRLAQMPDGEAEALRFLSYALPKRPAVWWAIRCIRSVLPQPSESDDKVLQAAEAWVVDPTDAHRRAAMDLAQKLECRTAACWPAVAAFWTHGSMAPPDVPAVPPKDEFTGKAVSGAVALAAVIDKPEKAPQKRAAFIDLAFAVASGEDTWQTE